MRREEDKECEYNELMNSTNSYRLWSSHNGPNAREIIKIIQNPISIITAIYSVDFL